MPAVDAGLRHRGRTDHYPLDPVEYPVETFSADERARLRQHVTNLDRPVFALVNLPETVKGALFARYSGTLRRLFLDGTAGRVSPCPSLAPPTLPGLDELRQRGWSGRTEPVVRWVLAASRPRRPARCRRPVAVRAARVWRLVAHVWPRRDR